MRKLHISAVSLFLLLLAVSGTWYWFGAPTRAANRFQAILKRGDVYEANSMLVNPCVFSVKGNGVVELNFSASSWARYSGVDAFKETEVVFKAWSTNDFLQRKRRFFLKGSRPDADNILFEVDVDRIKATLDLH